MEEALRAEGISKSYGEGDTRVAALVDVSLRLERGAVVG